VGARARFEESLVISREQGHKPDFVANLEGLAAVAVAQGRPERAARLFAVAEALREAMGVVLTPADPAEHDRSVAAARTTLGEEAFAAAWAEGRAMAMADAIEYALRD